MVRIKTVTIAAFLVLTLCCLAAAAPSDAAEGEAATSSGQSLQDLKELCETGWDFGLSLEITDDVAFGIFKDVVEANPELKDLDPIIGAIVDDPDLTASDLYGLFFLSGGGSVESVTGDSSAKLYLHTTCTAADSGYLVTVDVAGSAGFSIRAEPAGSDPEHPDVDLVATYAVMYDGAASMSVLLSEDMVPLRIDAAGQLTGTRETDANFTSEYDYVQGEDGTITVKNSFSVGDISQTSTSTESLRATVIFDGLMPEDVETILFGDGSGDVEALATIAAKIVTTSSSTTSIPDQISETEQYYDYGLEVRGTAYLPSGLLTEYGLDDSDLSDIIANGANMPGYDLVSEIMAGLGYTISQEEYDLAVGAVTDALGGLRDAGAGEFFYTLGDSVYNQNAKPGILGKIPGMEAGLDLIMDIDGDYELGYFRVQDDAPYTIEHFQCGDAEMPGTIHGAPATTDMPEVPLRIVIESDGEFWVEDDEGNRVTDPTAVYDSDVDFDNSTDTLTVGDRVYHIRYSSENGDAYQYGGYNHYYHNGILTIELYYHKITTYYSITWIVEGDMTMVEDVPKGTIPQPPEVALTKTEDGRTYYFVGWDPEVERAWSDRTYTAVYDENPPCTVTFAVKVDPEGAGLVSVSEESVTVRFGTEMTFINVSEGIRIGEVDVFVDGGKLDDQFSYVLDHWECPSGTVTEGMVITSDMTVTAVFIKETNRYAVTFEVDPETPWGTLVGADTEYSLDYGTPIVVDGTDITVGPAYVTAQPNEDDGRYGYSFVRWEHDGDTVTGNMTIRAVFARVPTECTVTFEVVGSDYGEVSETSLTVPYGSIFAVASDQLTVNGCIVYADIKEDDERHIYSMTWSVKNGDMVTGDMKVTATFVQDDRTYRIVFKDGDSMVSSQYLKYEETIVAPAGPEKEADSKYSYKFNGWNGYTEGMKVTGNVTFTAEYEQTPQTYKVTYRLAGAPAGVSTPASEEKQYGSSVTVPMAGMTVDGYTMVVTMDGETLTTGTFTMPDHNVLVRYEYTKVEVPSTPDTDTPGTDTPGTDTPGTDTPGTDTPGTDTPGTDTPGTDTPGTDTPGTDDPSIDTPGTDTPGTDTPGTDTPGTDDEPVTPSLPDSVTTSADGSATIGKEIVEAMAEAGRGLTVNSADGILILSPEAVKTLADGDGDATVTIRDAAASDLSEAQAEAVGDSLALVVEATVGSVAVTSLNGSATISVPFEADDPELVRAYHVASDGTLEELDAIYANGTATFVTTHFSVFMVTEADTSGGGSSDGGSDNMLLIAGIAVVIIVVIIAAVLVMRGRNV